MKKTTTMIMALAFASSAVFAQDLTSKKGEPMLPEAGDWAIGFDAVPFLNYAGNLFSGSTSANGSPNATWVNSSRQTIYGKMFKDEKTAYRAQLRIGFGGTSADSSIADATIATPPVYPNPNAMVTDNYKTGYSYIGLGVGYEMRRGKTRLQGYYGGDLLFWTSASKAEYTYGNTLNPTGTPPVTVANSTNFGSNMTTDPFGNAARVTEWKSGRTIGLGLRGFVGAEYFVLPKISVGAEYGWGLGLSKTGASSTSVESIDSVSGTQTSTITTDGSKSGNWKVDTDLNGNGSGTASLIIMFHF